MAKRDRLEKWKRHRDVIVSYDVVNCYVLLAVIDLGSQKDIGPGKVETSSRRHHAVASFIVTFCLQ